MENSSSSLLAMKSTIMEMDTHDEVINANVVIPNPNKENLAGTFSYSKTSTPTTAPSWHLAGTVLASNFMIVGATQPHLPLEPILGENPMNSRAYTDGDTFLVKLHEIDYDL